MSHAATLMKESIQLGGKATVGQGAVPSRAGRSSAMTRQQRWAKLALERVRDHKGNGF
jgi:hypothetical protein